MSAPAFLTLGAVFEFVWFVKCKLFELRSSLLRASPGGT